jgi:hypothetical protein
MLNFALKLSNWLGRKKNDFTAGLHRTALERSDKLYDRKSRTNQRCFKSLRLTEIIAAATIPFLSGFAGNSFPIKIAIGGLGVVVAVIASLLGLLHLQEHWIGYRATAESLEREKFLFLTQTEPYDKGDAFHLLVQRVEALLSIEGTEWVQSMMKPPKGESRA